MAISITTTSLPTGIVGTAYSQTVVSTGGQAPLTFTVSTGTLPAGLTLAASTGVISGTPTTAANYNFTIQVEDDDSFTDTQAFSVRIYAALNPSPDPISPATSVVVEGGSQVDFNVTGGSGNFIWSVDGGNLINPNTGLLTAINGGSYTVTVTDTESGQVATISIVITSQGQFCVESTSVDAEPGVMDDTCCEFNVECGDRLQLRIPSFHMVVDGQKQNITYGNLVQVVTGDAAALQTKANVAGATGNSVSFNKDAYYEIVTSFDMAATANGDFAIGFSSSDIDATVASIDHTIVWFTESAARKVEIRHAGTPEASSKFAIAQGDVVSFGKINGDLALWINSVLQHTSTADVTTCGNVLLDIGVEEANKTLGGYVTNLTWSVVTADTGAEVGSIDAGGVYSSPSNPLAGVVRVVGALNNANFYVNVRNIQPTPRYTKPQAFLNGRKAVLWVSNQRATDNDPVRLASDGSPDALQNPGMLDLGTLRASATFAEEITYQDFDNDDGTYDTAIASEKASLKGMFEEVRDFDKMALLMQHSTLYPTVKGVREIGVGGKTCGACDLRIILVVESGNCGSGWDVIYIPRAQNTSNLSLEIGRKVASGYDITFRVLPDPTRTIGKQLYSIYQLPNCADTQSGTTCE